MNIKTSQVALDRRVSVIEGLCKDAHLIRSVRELRRFKRVVLIGGPGMGKSAVLEKEAQDAHTKKINVRTLVNSPDETIYTDRAYLDALDEYRSDGSAADKANFLASSLATKCPDGWILSCRSQDWRKDADLNAINERYGQSDTIVVASVRHLTEDSQYVSGAPQLLEQKIKGQLCGTKPPLGLFPPRAVSGRGCVKTQTCDVSRRARFGHLSNRSAKCATERT